VSVLILSRREETKGGVAASRVDHASMNSNTARRAPPRSLNGHGPLGVALLHAYDLYR